MKWRENIVMKALAFMAAVAAFTATAIMSWYQLANFDALWGSANENDSYTLGYLVKMDYHLVSSLLKYYQIEQQGGTLSAYQQRNQKQLEETLSTEHTNLRWQLVDLDGSVLYGNTSESGPGRGTEYWYPYTIENSVNSVEEDYLYWPEVAQTAANTQGNSGSIVYLMDWRETLTQFMEQLNFGEDPPKVLEEAVQDVIDSGSGSLEYENIVTTDGDLGDMSPATVFADRTGMTEVLLITTSEGQFAYGPTVENTQNANQFGYRFNLDSMSWEKVSQEDEAIANLVLWVNRDNMVNDQYYKAVTALEQWQRSRGQYLITTIVCVVSGVLLTVYLCVGVGHKRGVDGITLNWFHRIPADLLLFILFLMAVASIGLGFEFMFNVYGDAPMYFQLIGLGTAVAVTAALGLGGLLTVCARCKAHTLFRNTLIRRMCSWCWHKVERCIAATGAAAAAVPLIWKAVLGCMGYTFFTIVMVDNGNATGLWLLVTAGVSVYLCLWAYQWKRIRYGTQEIIRGNPNYHIRTERMLPDLRGHADELNNLGQAISAAVEDRLTSEHFKAELITNVSHDLKTPLTSIINYVDLLKKERIDNPKAAEYIEVLDRKSQRLKKLTEDLVEASKASTGNLTVSWERLDLCQLTDQALGEYSERLEAQGLTVVRSLPEEPVWVEADGRHLWRVLENLLSNCAKYALAGTRVYIDLHQDGDWAMLSVKNISRDALDIPAERLMERFVQGDESRNASGSGLGLSIAQSLTELQRGQFKISIDGDLFKAIVTLPLLYEEPNGLIGFLP